MPDYPQPNTKKTILYEKEHHYVFLRSPERSWTSCKIFQVAFFSYTCYIYPI
jgi:hypothetical protein